jgi:hypothetical protein
MQPPLEMLFQGRLNAQRYKCSIFTDNGIVAIFQTASEDQF